MSDFNGKHRFPLYIKEDDLAAVKSMYREYGCASQSEFIEKAVEFYLGYLKMDMDMGPYRASCYVNDTKCSDREYDEDYKTSI